MIQYIVTPLVAAAVGYFTNDIAIRMLFRPHKPWYLWGHHVPLTPGLIPKERGRIATSLGQSISQNLMNPEVLERTLLSDEMVMKVRETIATYFTDLQKEQTSIRIYLTRILSEQDIAEIETSAIDELGALVTTKLVDSDLGSKIAHLAVEHALMKMSGGVLGLLGGDKLLRHLQEPAENLLRENIDQLLAKNGPEMAQEMVQDSVEDFLGQPVSTLLSGKEEKIESMTNSIINLYRRTIEQNLPKVIAALDLPKIIEGRINEMDMAELERLIFEIMDKELKAIVWFGAALGFLIGCLNCLIL